VCGADDAEDPALIPIYWVSKWVDYSDKYGLGYQLCDNSVGVLFNDSTRLILTCNGEYVLVCVTAYRVS
jgi:polo-like kinase 1